MVYRFNNMNLQETIRKVLREETSNPINLILRRLESVDWLVEFSVREIQRQYNGICNVRTPENFVEIVIEKTGDGVYWDYFSESIDEGSDEWGQMYRFIEKYVEAKFGDTLRSNFNRLCRRIK